MKIAFTLCSNNYLAHAKTLIDSIKMFSNHHHCILGLVDKRNESIDYSVFRNVEILEAEDVWSSDFSELWKRYNIVELNTCLKPFYFDKIISSYDDLEEVVYFDPDIRLFNSLRIISQYLQDNDILLTPHFVTPIMSDGKAPFETLSLNYGLYNLGFIALKKTDNVVNFLKWWSERTHKFCFQRVEEGLFVDQLWMNLAPLFFEKVKILDNVGMNVAPWNLHERVISYDRKEFRVNTVSPLIFYHFSRYLPENKHKPFDVWTRYNFENRPDLIPLYETYHQEVVNNSYFTVKPIKCAYVDMRNHYESNKISAARQLLRKYMPDMMKRIYHAIAR